VSTRPSRESKNVFEISQHLSTTFRHGSDSAPAGRPQRTRARPTPHTRHHRIFLKNRQQFVYECYLVCTKVGTPSRLALAPGSGLQSARGKPATWSVHQKRIDFPDFTTKGSHRRMVVVPASTCGIGVGILLIFKSFSSRFCARSSPSGIG
jgi:hypothetical protein